MKLPTNDRFKTPGNTLRAQAFLASFTVTYFIQNFPDIQKPWNISPEDKIQREAFF